MAIDYPGWTLTFARYKKFNIMSSEEETSLTDQALLIEVLSQLTETDPPRSGDLITFFMEHPDVLRALRLRAATRLSSLTSRVEKAQSCLNQMKSTVHRALSDAVREVNAQTAANAAKSDELTERISRLEADYRNRCATCEQLDLEMEAARLEEQRLLDDNAELFAAAKSSRLPRMEEGRRDLDDLKRLIEGHHAFLAFLGNPSPAEAGGTGPVGSSEDDDVIMMGSGLRTRHGRS
jgi:chromosome segregation ATPase